MFLFAVPIAVVAFVLALFLPQVAMRGVARVSGVGDGFAIPEGSDNENQLANVVGQVLRRDNRSSLAAILADAGTTLDLATVWGLMGVFVREHAFGRPVREADVETKAWLMGELRGWLEEREINSAQRQQVEDAIGRITLRMVREADAEASRAGYPGASRAATAAAQ